MALDVTDSHAAVRHLGWLADALEADPDLLVGGRRAEVVEAVARCAVVGLVGSPPPSMAEGSWCPWVNPGWAARTVVRCLVVAALVDDRFPEVVEAVAAGLRGRLIHLVDLPEVDGVAFPARVAELLDEWERRTSGLLAG